MLASVDGVFASVEHSKLSISMILCFVVLWLMFVDRVLYPVEHSKPYKSIILCFMMLWPDAGDRRRSISYAVVG